jgi:acetyl-CoA/propionyl-CoA carboxylase biotin carboxyl carrier protein
VAEGDVVGVNYDPLLSKLIAFGENREAAIARAVAALRAYPVLGIRNNIPFLISLLEHPSLRVAELHTGLIDEILPQLTPASDVPPEVLAAAAFATHTNQGSRSSRDVDAAPDPWETIERWGRWL